jgi:hypothetical protein
VYAITRQVQRLKETHNFHALHAVSVLYRHCRAVFVDVRRRLCVPLLCLCGIWRNERKEELVRRLFLLFLL